MTTIQVDTQADKYIISIDRSAVDRQWLAQLVERIRIEELAAQFNFGEDVEALGDQIKADWWTKNKSRFINE